MNDEFHVDEEEGGGTTGNRTFNILAGVATAVLLLGLICIAAVLFLRPQDTTDEEAVAMRLTENAIIAVTNEAVTRTLEAMATEDARPTDTPTNTPEPSPTNTPEPTETPVLLPVDEEEDLDEEDELVTPDSLATAIAEAEAADDDAVAGTPVPAVTPGTTVDTLPDTGIDTWGAILLAFLLVGMFMAARRLRSS